MRKETSFSCRAVLGSSRVMALDSAELATPDAAASALREVLSFASLCPFDFDPSILALKANVDRRSTNSIPTHLCIDNSTRSQLWEFFKPYNQALETLLNRSFAWTGWS